MNPNHDVKTDGLRTHMVKGGPIGKTPPSANGRKALADTTIQDLSERELEIFECFMTLSADQIRDGRLPERVAIAIIKAEGGKAWTENNLTRGTRNMFKDRWGRYATTANTVHMLNIQEAKAILLCRRGFTNSGARHDKITYWGAFWSGVLRDLRKAKLKVWDEKVAEPAKYIAKEVKEIGEAFVSNPIDFLEAYHGGVFRDVRNRLEVVSGASYEQIKGALHFGAETTVLKVKGAIEDYKQKFRDDPQLCVIEVSVEGIKYLLMRRYVAKPGRNGASPTNGLPTRKKTSVDSNASKPISKKTSSQSPVPKKATPDDVRDPKPNTTYEDNGYFYRTDSQGRLSEVSGQLRLKKASRNSYQQSKVAKSSGVAGDEGGHMIGAQFDGPGEGPLHMVPQSMKLNRGKGSSWTAMEREWANALKRGDKVNVEKIQVNWKPGAKRPDSFDVRYEITDAKTGHKTQVSKTFLN